MAVAPHCLHGMDGFRCIDFHTHHPSREGERVIQDGVDTWGIHPWHADEAVVPPDSPGAWLAVGECGLDALSPVPAGRQREVWLTQCRLAGQWGLPLIVHCVRRIDEVLSTRKALVPAVPWVMHGFRGKPQQLRSLLDAGMYVSFGFRHNVQSLLACPLDRLMLETDDDSRPVGLLYDQVARLRGMSVRELQEAMREQFLRVFQPQGSVCL